IGSSRPNLARSARPTSGGTFGLVASSENGSPGASASTMNRTSEMPSRLGTAISRRRRIYCPIRERSFYDGPASRLPIPVLQIIQLLGTAAHHRAQRVGAGTDLDAVHDGDDHRFLPKQVVGLDV